MEMSPFQKKLEKYDIQTTSNYNLHNATKRYRLVRLVPQQPGKREALFKLEAEKIEEGFVEPEYMIASQPGI